MARKHAAEPALRLSFVRSRDVIAAVLPLSEIMKCEPRNVICVLAAATFFLVSFFWFVRKHAAIIEVVAIGTEVDGLTPMELRVSYGEFSRCVVTCDVNGKQVSRSDYTDLQHVTVNVLTGSKKYHKSGEDVDVLHIAAAGERIAVTTPMKRILLFECVDDLNQRWEHCVHFQR